MKDLITYTPSISTMVAEGVEIASNPEHPAHGMFTVDEDGKSLTFNVTKVPVVYSASGSTLSLVRGVPESIFSELTSIEVIGYYDHATNSYIFYDGGKEKYESVYSVEPVVIDGIDYHPPYMLGVFA